MSMEISVFFSGKLPSKAALTRCFKELGFPLTFQPGMGTLEQQDGYLPMRLRGEESGIEFYTSNGREELEEFREDLEIEIDSRFTRIVHFHWSFSIEEGTVALCFAAALARLVNGAVFEDMSAKMLSVEETIARAHKDLKDTAPPPNQRATRPVDIRHYLRPLLQQRKDLALVGRMLVIRPVRHLLRGAFLGRTSNRYTFQVWRYITPLYAASPDRLGYGGYVHRHAYEVWQPHFEPLLIDTLAEDIFEGLGKITSLSDFACLQSGKGDSFEVGLTSLFLGGASAQADEYLAGLPASAQRVKDARRVLKSLRQAFFSNGRERAIAEFHAREGAAAKALKIEHIWEPAPFAVERPAAERAAKTDEPVFLMAPWPTRPSWLWQQLPRASGEIRDAKEALYRAGGVLLLAALTPEEAEERHRMREAYVLAARLPDDLLVLIRRTTSWDRHAPQQFPLQRRPSEPGIHISLHGRSHVAAASISRVDDSRDVMELHSFSIHKEAWSDEIWDCSLNFESDTRSVSDYRSGECVSNETTITTTERELARCPVPAFGEYAGLAEQFRSLLRVTGFGEVS